MADARLGILISADTSQAQAGLDKLKQSLTIVSIGSEKFGLTLNSLSEKVAQFGGGVNKFSSSFTGISSGINKFSSSIVDAQGKLRQLPSNVIPASNSIDALHKRIRLSTDATEGFARITSSLPGILSGIESPSQAIASHFQVLAIGLKNARAEGQSFSKIAGTLVSGLFSIQGAITVASTLLLAFGEKLFDTGENFSQASILAAKFKNALDDIGKAADDLKDRLDFENKIAKLKAQISGLKDEELNIFDINNQISASQKEIFSTNKDIDALEKRKKLFEDYANSLKQFGKESLDVVGKQGALEELLNTFSDPKKIPSELISKLSEKEQAGLNSYIGVLKELDNANNRSAKAQQSFAENVFQKQVLENQKRDNENKKLLQDNEKFIEQTIAQGKRLAAAFGDVTKVHLSVLPTFTELDTKPEQFKKAKEIIKNVNNFFNDFSSKQRALKLVIPVQPEPIFFPPEQSDIKRTQDEITEILKGIRLDPVEAEVPFDISIKTAQDFEKFKKSLSDSLAQAFNIKITPPDLTDAEKQLLNIQNQAIFAANSISGILTPAFQDLFTAIEQGDDPLRAFFKGIEQQVQQLISKLIAAAVEALILSAIFGTVGGAKGFGAIFGKLLGFAEGGRPEVGKTSMTGERGKEVFLPDSGKPILLGLKGMELFNPKVPGKIVPNYIFKSVITKIEKEKELSKIYSTIYKNVSSLKNVFNEIDITDNKYSFNDSHNSISNLINEKISSIYSNLKSIFLNKSFTKILGFAEGGRPPINKQSIAGEKGKELWFPDVISKNSNSISNIFSNKQTILADKPTIIGEHGAQLFKPTAPGFIVPNNKVNQVMNNIRNYFSNSTLSSIKNPISNFSSNLSKVFNSSIMRREGGGSVFSGIPFLGGEGGREIFIPLSVAQQMPKMNLSSISEPSTQNIHITGDFKGSGNDFALMINRVIRTQQRNFGRG